jgi:hypothetical protein
MRGLYPILILFLTAMACAPTHQTTLSVEGNGGAYPGGDDMNGLAAGEFYNIVPDWSCNDFSADPDTPVRRFTHYRKLTFEPATFRPVLGKTVCDSQYVSLLKWEAIEYSFYNTEFVGFHSALLEKRETAPDVTSKEDFIGEVWCRTLDATPLIGTDAVIRVRRSDQARTLTVFSASDSDPTQRSRTVSGEVTLKNINGDLLFENAGNSLLVKLTLAPYDSVNLKYFAVFNLTTEMVCRRQSIQ